MQWSKAVLPSKQQEAGVIHSQVANMRHMSAAHTRRVVTEVNILYRYNGGTCAQLKRTRDVCNYIIMPPARAHL